MQCKALSAAMVLLLALPLTGRLLAQEDEVELLRSDSSTPYVHRITLYDHAGAVIDPRDPLAGPYSPKMTCGKCHPYADVSTGWHFNAAIETMPAGRPGEPWLLVDPQTGTQLPISGRKWPGTYTPEEAGLTNWEFVMRFGRHIPGGSLGEPSDEQVQNSPKKLRWGVSGRLEIDCMFCHSADQQHDPAEAAAQIEKENFRWAPTAAFGLAAIRGEARHAPDDWDPLMEPDPDFPERSGPKLAWDLSRFDADDRVLFNIVRRPSADRCYFCHSFRQVGTGAIPKHMAAEDVHLAAGLTCVDCHRHGIDHRMVRGYATEAADRGEPEVATFSCEGCHLGVEGATAPLVALGGRYGAPHPEHPGLPPLHFDKLTCTACHSGPWPETYAKRFQTAMAHGLGLPTRERTGDDPPRIVGPIFGRQPDGKIAPQRMVWPGYLGVMLGNEQIVPFDLDSATGLVKEGMAEVHRTSRSHDTGLFDTPESIANMLEAIAHATQFTSEGWLTYAANGRVHSLDDAGVVTIANHSVVDPYRWSIAHNVRPAAQSLGARDCTDCHADGAPIQFGRIGDVDDPAASERPVQYMHELRGDDVPLARAWASGFGFRPAFKWFGVVCAGMVGLVLLHYVLAGVGAITRRFR